MFSVVFSIASYCYFVAVQTDCQHAREAKFCSVMFYLSVSMYQNQGEGSFCFLRAT